MVAAAGGFAPVKNSYLVLAGHCLFCFAFRRLVQPLLMLLQREQVKAPSLKSFSCHARALLLCKMTHGAQQGPAWPGWSQAHLKSPNTLSSGSCSGQRGAVFLRPPSPAFTQPWHIQLCRQEHLCDLSACQNPGESQLSPQLSTKEGNLLFWKQPLCTVLPVSPGSCSHRDG